MSRFFERWVTSHSGVMSGEPVIVGTRVTIRSLEERLSVGESVEQLSEAFPHVPKEALVELAQEFVSLTHEQIAEIRRRSAEIDAGLAVLSPWNEVRDRVHSKVFGTRTADEEASSPDGRLDDLRNDS